MDIDIYSKETERNRNFEPVERWGRRWLEEKRSERDKRETRVGRKERVEEKIQPRRGITKETVSPSVTKDERGEEKTSGRGGKPKGELDIYIGDSRLCTKKNPFQRRIARTRPRRIRRGWLCQPRVHINFSEFFIQ